METSRQGYASTMNDEFGYVAYVNYGNSVGWVTHLGAPMPDWDALTVPVRIAWCQAASAVIDFYLETTIPVFEEYY